MPERIRGQQFEAAHHGRVAAPPVGGAPIPVVCVFIPVQAHRYVNIMKVEKLQIIRVKQDSVSLHVEVDPSIGRSAYLLYYVLDQFDAGQQWLAAVENHL